MGEVESSGSALRVEPLRAAHLTWLQASDQAHLLPRLQSFLIRGWIAQAENLMPGLLVSRQPLALVAHEDHCLRTLLLIRPHNRQGSCWRLELQPLTPARSVREADVMRELFQLALLGAHARSQSWVVRVRCSDQVQIAALRELGFQPIRTLRRWRPPSGSNPRGSDRSAIADLPRGCRWAGIDRRTASVLWPLDQASTTSHQRQIVDRQPIDLLDQAGPGSGMLLVDSEKESGGPNSREVAIVGLVRHQRSDGEQVLEILREPAWDERLQNALPALMQRLAADHPRVTVVCNSDDGIVCDRMNQLGWSSRDDELLLGRSLWRRQQNGRLLQATRPLESMLGRLQPQRPPLPTPSLGGRR